MMFGWRSRAIGLGLGPEPVELIGRGVPALGDRLDRHDAVELLVAGLVDDAHAARGRSRPRIS